MKATQQLRNEHEGIKLMLSIMEKFAENINSGNSPNYEHLDEIIDFIIVFADKCHHGKEEDILFPGLETHGMSKDSGPIAVMLYEHEQGRSYIKKLSNSYNDFINGNTEATSGIVENILNYTNLLRNHIEKENNVLFMMADRVLNDAEQSKMFEAFEKLEVEKIGIGKHEEYHQLLKKFEKIYLH